MERRSGISNWTAKRSYEYFRSIWRKNCSLTEKFTNNGAANWNTGSSVWKPIQNIGQINKWPWDRIEWNKLKVFSSKLHIRVIRGYKNWKSKSRESKWAERVCGRNFHED